MRYRPGSRRLAAACQWAWRGDQSHTVRVRANVAPVSFEAISATRTSRSARRHGPLVRPLHVPLASCNGDQLLAGGGEVLAGRVWSEVRSKPHGWRPDDRSTRDELDYH
jgi:hypothetical protein